MQKNHSSNWQQYNQIQNDGIQNDNNITKFKTTVFKLIIEPKLDSKTAKTYQEKMERKKISNRGARIKHEKKEQE